MGSAFSANIWDLSLRSSILNNFNQFPDTSILCLNGIFSRVCYFSVGLVVIHYVRLFIQFKEVSGRLFETGLALVQKAFGQFGWDFV